MKTLSQYSQKFNNKKLVISDMRQGFYTYSCKYIKLISYELEQDISNFCWELKQYQCEENCKGFKGRLFLSRNLNCRNTNAGPSNPLTSKFLHQSTTLTTGKASYEVTMDKILNLIIVVMTLVFLICQGLFIHTIEQRHSGSNESSKQQNKFKK